MILKQGKTTKEASRQISKGQLMQRGTAEGCDKVTFWVCDKRP